MSTWSDSISGVSPTPAGKYWTHCWVASASDIAVSHHLLALSGEKGGHAEVQGGGKGRQSVQSSDEGGNTWSGRALEHPE